MYVNPRFQVKKFQEEEDLIVILMPFSPKWSNDVFKVFSSSAKSKNFRVWRSDLTFKDDNIMQTIWENINKAKFIIADCTGKNPNVFYELGIAHTVGKPVFICAQDRMDIPFDIAAVRSYTYDVLPTELKTLSKTLKSFIDQL